MGTTPTSSHSNCSQAAQETVTVSPRVCSAEFQKPSGLSLKEAHTHLPADAEPAGCCQADATTLQRVKHCGGCETRQSSRGPEQTDGRFRHPLQGGGGGRREHALQLGPCTWPSLTRGIVNSQHRCPTRPQKQKPETPATTSSRTQG